MIKKIISGGQTGKGKQRDNHRNQAIPKRLEVF
jgi:hypothetical protein